MESISSVISVAVQPPRTAAANARPVAVESGKTSPPGKAPVLDSAESVAAAFTKFNDASESQIDPTQRIEEQQKALQKLNDMLRSRERELEFSVDETTGRTIVKVIHAESGEVIRQIPAEEILQIARTFIEGTGSLIRDEA